jgi:uncharacterized protein
MPRHGCQNQDWRAIGLWLLLWCSLVTTWSGADEGFVAFYRAYERGDYVTVYRELLPLARRGDVFAQGILGVLYHDGLGVPQDYAEAAKWFQLAATQGLAVAQYRLALQYKTGRGLPLSYMEAAKWFRLAATQGNADAQFALGLMYFQGEGIPQDHAEAAKWFRTAAEHGQSGAQGMLGTLYDYGSQGVPPDYGLAALWYRKAAEQGDAVAQLNLGIMYANGRGVHQDLLQAHLWLNLAAARLPAGAHQKNAAEARNMVAARMTPAQIAEAQRRARAWQPQKMNTPPQQKP